MTEDKVKDFAIIVALSLAIACFLILIYQVHTEKSYEEILEGKPCSVLMDIDWNEGIVWDYFKGVKRNMTFEQYDRIEECCCSQHRCICEHW